MNKKYTRKKATPKRRAHTKEASPQLTWLLLGFIVGLLIPGILYLKYHASSHHHQAKPELIFATEEDEKPKHHAKKTKPTVTAKKEPANVHKPIEHHSQYDFYNMLSQEDSPQKPENEIEASQKEEVVVNKKFILDIASFETFEEADQLKAQLALMGFDSHISKALSNNQLFYHVTTGPFTSEKEAVKVQKQLKENNYKSSLLSK